jgi:hypothetical protein
MYELFGRLEHVPEAREHGRAELEFLERTRAQPVRGQGLSHLDSFDNRDDPLARGSGRRAPRRNRHGVPP